MKFSNPFDFFADWFSQVSETPLDKPNAMVLSTSSDDGLAVSRIVLLSSFSDKGFVFHSNYNSNKGKQLERNGRASLLFWWDDPGYQIRIEGHIEKTTAAESDEYFSSRPRGSQIGAWASDQSSMIKSRDVLEQAVNRFEEQFRDKEVDRPPHWGGYRLKPEYFEFWINRDSRLHDRIEYKLNDKGQWDKALLAP